MSIEIKKPTHEFYDSLDMFVNHATKSRDAFKMAVEIARNQGFNEYRIRDFIREYMKDKIPKTSLFRYVRELVPLEQSDSGVNEVASAILEVKEKFEKNLEDLSDLLDNWDEYKMEAKLNTLKPKERKAFTKWLRQYTKFLKAMKMMLKSCNDERYSYSKWKWFEIAADIEKYGYGYAAHKFKVEIIDHDGNKTGIYWKFTRKQAKKMMPGLEQDMIDFADAIGWYVKEILSMESRKLDLSIS